MINLPQEDPFFEREAAKYGHPIPSREFILQKLEALGVPVHEEALAETFALQAEEAEAFRRRIRAMEREGQLLRNRKGMLCLPEKLQLVSGIVQGHSSGFGFLVVAGGKDIFLPPKQMRKVFPGDKVLARIVAGERKSRPEGVIVEVLERHTEFVVGQLIVEHGVILVTPEDKRITQDVLIAPNKTKDAKPGDIVSTHIIEQPGDRTRPVGEVVEILGQYDDPGIEIEIAVRKYHLPFVFSKAVLDEARHLPAKITKENLSGRKDLRDLPLVTIDGEDARDFDDAVYCTPSKDGFYLIVAIADVTHYVKPETALDEEAFLRGNSTYFPRKVIPMLPERLSNDLCSLVPGKDRLALACEMEITSSGIIRHYAFYPAVIRSHARLTYTEVAASLADPQRRSDYPHLVDLEAVYEALLQERKKRGAIDFETVEPGFIFNEAGRIETIVAKERNIAHRIIEECMLAANVCASKFLHSRKTPTLYRVHEGPSPEKLEQLRTFLKEFGLRLPGGEKPTAKHFANLIERIKHRAEKNLLQIMILRSLSQAVYRPVNVGHFSLAYEAYTHFTSPIRRYPDVIVHRALKSLVDGEVYNPKHLEEIGAHCSYTERRSDEAEFEVEQFLKCLYMQERLGNTYEGVITGATSFGVFVTLSDLFVEGLVHVTELGNDYFRFVQERQMLMGERTHKTYRLGDKMKVRVARVDLPSRQIDFVPV